jgi:hypothetical protein
MCADWRFVDLGKSIVKLVNFMMWISGSRGAPFPKAVNHAAIFWREQPQLDVGIDRISLNNCKFDCMRQSKC